MIGNNCRKCGKPIIVIDKDTYYAYEDRSPIDPIGEIVCKECSDKRRGAAA